MRRASTNTPTNDLTIIALSSKRSAARLAVRTISGLAQITTVQPSLFTVAGQLQYMVPGPPACGLPLACSHLSLSAANRSVPSRVLYLNTVY